VRGRNTNASLLKRSENGTGRKPQPVGREATDLIERKKMKE